MQAERLYKQCKRYDLLNMLYMACGKWDLALNTAENHDRIHLRTIHYTYARCSLSASLLCMINQVPDSPHKSPFSALTTFLGQGKARPMYSRYSTGMSGSR